MYKTSLGSVTAELEDLLAEKMSAKGRNLKQKVESAGRRLPASVRSQASYLIEVEQRASNPKFAHQYDTKRVLKAHKHCVSHLEKIDLVAQRKWRWNVWFVCTTINLFLFVVLFALALDYLGVV